MAGAIRKIKKSMTHKVSLADTGMVFNDCKVALVVQNPAVAKKVAGAFALYLQALLARAQCTNIKDLYEAHFSVLQQIEVGDLNLQESMPNVEKV